MQCVRKLIYSNCSSNCEFKQHFNAFNPESQAISFFDLIRTTHSRIHRKFTSTAECNATENDDDNDKDDGIDKHGDANSIILN